MKPIVGQKGLVHALGLVGLFAATFVPVCVVLSLVLRANAPPPEMIVLSPKLDVYREAPENYDTVFVGTSRTLYHVVPETIESAAHAEGCETPRVFNFGVHGLNGAEQDWLIAQVLDIGGAHIRTVVLEDPLPESRSFSEVSSSRQRFFHGPANYADTLQSIASFPESVPKRLFRVGVFAYGTAYDLSGVGRAAEQAFPELAETEDARSTFRAERGFEALDEIADPGILARHQAFVDAPEQFDASLEKYHWNDSPNLAARAEYLIGKLRRLEERGLSTALYVSPDPQELDRTPQVGARVASLASDLPVLNYNRPDLYPDLFERAIWHDLSHVNRAGAVLLSEKIGRDLCQSGVLDRAEVAHAVR